MNIIEDIEIQAYKGIEEISFPCNSINIIVGPNNTGKSSILESIWLAVSSINNFTDSLGNEFEDLIGKEDSLEYLDDFKYLIFEGKNESKIKLRFSENNNVELNLKYCEKGYLEEISDFFRNFLLSLNDSDLSPWAYEIFGSRERDIDYRLRELQRIGRLYKPDESKEKFDLLVKELSDIVDSKKEKIRNELISSKKLFAISRVNEKLTAIYLLTKIYEGQIFSQYNDVNDVNSGPVKNIPLLISSPNIAADVSVLHDKLLSGNKIQEVIKTLKKKIPYFEDIRKKNDALVVLLNNVTEPLPFAFMGDGFKALLKLTFMAPLVENGIVLFEEPEVSMHPGYLDILADELVSSSEASQFFVSTHSLEFIDYLLEIAEKRNKIDNINIIKLHRLSNGEIERQIYGGREAKQKIEDIQIDLRGY